MPVAAEQAVEKASMSWGVGCCSGVWDERSGGAELYCFFALGRRASL
jgi:hypothetical protein